MDTKKIKEAIRFIEKTTNKKVRLVEAKQEQYEVKIDFDVYEDDFNEGEGKNVRSFNTETTVFADTPMLAVAQALKEEGYSFNPKDANVDGNTVYYTNLVQENPDGYTEVNERYKVYVAWTKGLAKLYSLNSTIKVFKSSQVYFK